MADTNWHFAPVAFEVFVRRAVLTRMLRIRKPVLVPVEKVIVWRLPSPTVVNDGMTTSFHDQARPQLLVSCNCASDVLERLTLQQAPENQDGQKQHRQGNGGQG